jgi:hypothetical protein
VKQKKGCPLDTYVRCLQKLGGENGNSISSESSHFKRALYLSQVRLLHLAKPVALAWSEQVQRKYHRKQLCIPVGFSDAVHCVSLPVLVSIYRICAENKIDLRGWFRSQFDRLGSVGFVYVGMCSGTNALRRYREWEVRQGGRFTRSEDREKALGSSIYKQIEQSIEDSHEVALKMSSKIRSMEPPNNVAGLLAMYPQVSAWYLVAHNDIRGFLETGEWDDPALMKHLQQFKKDKRIQVSCSMGLEASIESQGSLRW